MKFNVVLLVALAAAAAAVTGFQHTEEWEAWKKEHGRVYESDEIEHRRHAIWEKKMKFIEEHNANADETGFTVEMNKFGDMENDEITQFYMGYIPDDEPDNIDDSSDNSTMTPDELEDEFELLRRLPSKVDWRRRGVVTSVKDQGRCGSCYAFGATGALEGQYARRTRRLVSFSEQQIIDCSGNYGNRGCRGGRPAWSFEYLEHIRGIQSERTYPYRSRKQRCMYRRRQAVTGCKSYRHVRRGNEYALMRAVARIGPIAVTIDASNTGFAHYKRGVYNEPRCNKRLSKLTHVVLVVGYGTHYGKRYWLVKNSWGRNWGMNGYIMMSRFKNNQCGIATKAVYPRVRILRSSG